MRYFIIGLIFTSIGCSALQNISPAQYVILIKSAARTGTYIGLTKTTDNNNQLRETANLLKSAIAENCLRLLDGQDVVLTETNVNLLLAKIPIQLRPYISDAVDILNSYMKNNNTYDLLDTHAVILLRTLFIGVIEGCDMILEEVSDDGLGNNSNVRTGERIEGGAYPFSRRHQNTPVN